MKGNTMNYMLFVFGIFLLIGIPLIALIEFKARQRREYTRLKAHEKVIELKQKGIWAEVCSQCQGKGRVGFVTHDCPKCGGIGYLYKMENSTKVPQS